jgi:IclR family acetate operon transcriptional repressor
MASVAPVAVEESRGITRVQARDAAPTIRSVQRALALIDAIAAAGGETSLSDLSVRTRLNISTCHHLLATLVACGYAAKIPGKKLYALGTRLVQIGHTSLHADLPRRADPFLDTISRATGETVHLAAVQGHAIVTLAVKEARHAVRVGAADIGKLEAPHATSIGKAILAWLPVHEIERVCAGRMQRFTEHTMTNMPQLLESLREVRREGFAMDLEEYQPGVICIGAPIRERAGAVIGAISVSMPKMRASEEHTAVARQEIVSAARALSEEYGAPGPAESSNTTNKHLKSLEG